MEDNCIFMFIVSYVSKWVITFLNNIILLSNNNNIIKKKIKLKQSYISKKDWELEHHYINKNWNKSYSNKRYSLINNLI